MDPIVRILAEESEKLDKNQLSSQRDITAWIKSDHMPRVRASVGTSTTPSKSSKPRKLRPERRLSIRVPLSQTPSPNICKKPMANVHLKRMSIALSNPSSISSIFRVNEFQQFSQVKRKIPDVSHAISANSVEEFLKKTKVNSFQPAKKRTVIRTKKLSPYEFNRELTGVSVYAQAMIL